MTDRNKKRTIIIDGFEFDAAYSDVSDAENLNCHLEERFNKFGIKDYMSRRHPELFPKHVGLRSDESLMLKVVLWDRGHLSAEGEWENTWKGTDPEDAAKYISDILDYHESTDPRFFNFIKNRIIR